MALPKLNAFAKKVSDLADKPNSTMTAAEVKAQFDAAPEELREFINTLSTQIETDFALRAELSGLALGSVPDGSITDVKLSGNSTEIKQRFTTHETEDASLTTVGHVQLSSSTNSTDETKAATPKAIKDVMDVAGAAIPFSQKGQANGVATLGSDGKIPSAQMNPIKQVSAGDTPILHETGITIGSNGTTSYTKLASYTLKDISGQLRISFKLSTSNSSYTAFAYISKNNVKVGTERSTTNVGGITFTEDISGWVNGDTVDIWAKISAGGGYTADVKELKIGIDTIKKV